MAGRILISIVLVLILYNSLSGKEKIQTQYQSVSIDSSLRENAWAVCRDYRHEFELQSYGKAVERVHMVFTILKKTGTFMEKFCFLTIKQPESFLYQVQLTIRWECLLIN